MLVGYNPVVQTFFGTLFTWGLTAAGAALVFVFQGGKRKVLDGSLGFAAGVMTAASYWSLLAPAIEMAEQSGMYGAQGQWAFIPVAIGFALGAGFVYGADFLLPYLGINDPNIALAIETGTKYEKEDIPTTVVTENNGTSTVIDSPALNTRSTTQRRKQQSHDSGDVPNYELNSQQDSNTARTSWKRILLLITAITIHNIPEGLAVGVGFGAVGKTASATFENARNLAIGIGIQNFPEGLAVSLPLRASGMSMLKSFWYGQLSGMVEPVAGIFGALAVVIAEPILPYALAFAAGAMIYVVFDDIIPEAQICGNGKLASLGGIVGFILNFKVSRCTLTMVTVSYFIYLYQKQTSMKIVTSVEMLTL
ncbi:unnamed protein product [Owenia fusiformis]|uniref:Zinc transporter ZIP11 n=1 Tax=Owenia fusiformis TaxID=6347 RepID=A0A8S4PQ97_OWEFU|nr:unnamed protein product [Owenia fusiformis]